MILFNEPNGCVLVVPPGVTGGFFIIADYKDDADLPACFADKYILDRTQLSANSFSLNIPHKSSFMNFFLAKNT